jgi:hypothetical protein
VIGVIVGRQRTNQLHTIGTRGIDDAPHVPGRIDRNAITGVAIADQVHEVLHLATDDAALCDIAAD